MILFLIIIIWLERLKSETASMTSISRGTTVSHSSRLVPPPAHLYNQDRICADLVGKDTTIK
jgi:hypothetical protein